MKNPAKQKMEKYIAAHPYLAETIELHESIAGLLAERVEPVALPTGEALTALVADGVPVLQHVRERELVVKSAALYLSQILPAIAELPVLPAPMQAALAAWSIADASAYRADREELFTLLIEQQDAELTEFIARHELNEALVRSISWALVDALIPRELKSSELWDTLKWTRNYCPVCGRQPVLAQLRKEKQGRIRYLACDGCHSVWQHRRIGCVYCGNDDLKKSHILEIEGEDAMRIDVCDECHSYLKTYADEGAERVYLRDYATVHLDLLADEQGLVKQGSVLLPSARP